MTTIRDWINTIDWSNSFPQNDTPKDLDPPITKEDIAATELFCLSILSTFDPQADIRSRLSLPSNNLIPSDLTGASVHFHHPYTQAIITECIFEIEPKGKSKRDLALLAAEYYQQSIIYFSQQSTPIDYWMSTVDATARAMKLFLSHQKHADDVLLSVIEYAKSIEGHKNYTMVLYNLTIAIMKTLKKKKATQENIDKYFGYLWHHISENRNHLATLTNEMIELAKLAKVSDFRSDCAEILLELSGTIATHGNPLVATATLHQAAKMARSTTGRLMPALMRFQEIIYPDTKDMLNPKQFASGNITKEIALLAPLHNDMMNAGDGYHALFILGSVNYFLPDKDSIVHNAESMGPSLMSQIVQFQPLGKHGPLNITEVEFRIKQSTDLSIYKRSLLFREVILKGQTQIYFTADLLTSIMVDSEIVHQSQEKILHKAFTLWLQDDFIPSNFMLIQI
ncbi:MAG: hypothetical protein HRT90_10810, partial [Candidatus Margulisbacteria bacterium]|nr:hypothetical protein [Candidatus Margulisiibacteriota bacterium]